MNSKIIRTFIILRLLLTKYTISYLTTQDHMEAGKLPVLYW